jgi:uncharacterized protein (DUF983 family)
MCSKHEPNGVMAFLKSKCPRCRSGKVFTHSFYQLRNFISTNERCPVCGLKFEKEVGFFWSAMYISYGINVGFSIIMGILVSIIFNDPDVSVYVWAIVGPVVLFSPLIFRYSRIITLYMLGGYKYDPNFARKA